MHLARRVVLVLGLGLCLETSVLTAAENRTAASRGGESAASRSPLVLMERLQGFLTSVWAKTGCAIDPWGRCSADQTTTNPVPPPASGPSEAVDADDGCAIDPWGACARND